MDWSGQVIREHFQKQLKLHHFPDLGLVFSETTYFQLATTLLIEHLRAKPTIHNEPHAPHRYFSANLIASISSCSQLVPASNLLHVCAFDITCMQELFTEQAMAAVLMLKLCTIIIRSSQYNNYDIYYSQNLCMPVLNAMRLIH